MPSFELVPQVRTSEGTESSGRGGLGSPILLHNVLWFTRVRWVVVAVLLAAGILSMVVSKELPWIEFLILAVVLALANAVFVSVAHRLDESSDPATLTTWIWVQILFDLLIVTALVHQIGSTTTFAPFAYLFHIALACIFLARGHSLLVTIAAALLYMTAVILDTTGLLSAPGIIAAGGMAAKPSIRIVMAGSAVFVWAVVWYLVSALAETVREQDERLRTANEDLRRAYYEKNQQVLVTTHDLKAPFAGIESNIQVLKYRFWDDIPEDVKAIVERIDLRAQALSERIKDILTLGDLRSGAESETEHGPTALTRVMNAVLDELIERAAGRNISINTVVPDIEVLGNRQQLCILFSNLLSNAIAYSQDGGTVDIECAATAEMVSVCVRDRGIGIREDALGHIFDEYYRTKEAARFNRLSTGLGLAIVKEIAERLGLVIRVTSELGEGTAFEVDIPRPKTSNKTGRD